MGFRNHHLLLMPLGELRGIHPGSEVIATGSPMRISVGAALKGRVLDGLGRPLDSLGPIVALPLPPPVKGGGFQIPLPSRERAGRGANSNSYRVPLRNGIRQSRRAGHTSDSQ